MGLGQEVVGIDAGGQHGRQAPDRRIGLDGRRQHHQIGLQDDPLVVD